MGPRGDPIVISFRLHVRRGTPREAAANADCHRARGAVKGASWQLCSLLPWDRPLGVGARGVGGRDSGTGRAAHLITPCERFTPTSSSRDRRELGVQVVASQGT